MWRVWRAFLERADVIKELITPSFKKNFFIFIPPFEICVQKIDSWPVFQRIAPFSCKMRGVKYIQRCDNKQRVLLCMLHLHRYATCKEHSTGKIYCFNQIGMHFNIFLSKCTWLPTTTTQTNHSRTENNLHSLINAPGRPHDDDPLIY